uniref:(California timema) hypothetical protein n=1 Tax=Timema californicum TaxID=61474 RepID=A0A7R9J1L4_TIMCA|nr:unnamed protein product [Timema californicum]
MSSAQGWAESPRRELTRGGDPEMGWTLWGSEINCQRGMALADRWGSGPPGLGPWGSGPVGQGLTGRAFSGTWYVVRAVRPPPRMQSRCTHVVVTQTRGDDLGLSTRFYSNVISQYSTFSGVLRRVEHSSRNAKFIYTRPGLYSEESARYTIMDTDYTNYAVVSFCASSKRSGIVKSDLD